jgi:PAS domain S-box-containing protein
VKPIDEKELIIAIEMAFARSEFEMQLEESEAKFRNLFEDSKDAIYIWKKDSGYLEFNQSMIDLFGYTADEMRKIRLRDFFPDRENLRKYLRTIKESGYVKDLNLKMRKKDGSVIVCIASTSVLKDPQGRFNGFQGIIRDITDLQLSIDRINGAMNGIIKAISNTVEKRDPYTAGHQKRVADISTAIGKIINMSEDRIKGLEMAALIHDLGKIHIPYEILNKPGRLSRIEFELIKSHPGVGYEILKSIDFPWPIADIVHQHHERMNGSGYPEGLSDGGILLESRIVSVADVVESMASHRPYRPAVGIEAALDEIKMNRGVLYDPEIVDACILLFIDKGFTLDMRW